jgi:hypothetical protein
MPPRRSAETDAARLLRQDVSLIGDLRKTPEAPPQLSVFDLARALTPSSSPSSVVGDVYLMVARLFAQYLDGDVSAVARVEQMAHVQEHLRLRETEADVLRWKRRPAWRRYWCCGSEGRE